MSKPQILGVYESETVTHYSVSAGRPGAQPVTVRIGQSGVYACLTCYSTKCEHVEAVRLPASTPQQARSA